MNEIKFSQLSVGEEFVLSSMSNDTHVKTEPTKVGPWICNCKDRYGLDFRCEPNQIVYAREVVIKKST